MTAATETLARVPLLAGLDKKSLASLAQAMQERTFDAGTQATVEGQVGLGFFIVLEGSATVTIDGRKVGTLGPDDWFGEMALLVSEGKRMATITADTDLRCVGMTRLAVPAVPRRAPRHHVAGHGDDGAPHRGRLVGVWLTAAHRFSTGFATPFIPSG